MTLLASLSDAATRFEAADLSLLEKRELQRRIDEKFALKGESALEFLRALNPDQYRLLEAGGQRDATYRTLYFDTDNLHFYHDHLFGRRLRQKVRIRHYPDRLVSFAEVKEKGNGSETRKSRFPQPFNVDSLDCTGSIEEIAGNLGPLKPQLWTNFRRITLLGTGWSERVTIDFCLEVRGDRVIKFENLAIIEVKQSPLFRDSPAMVELRRMRIKSGSLSKYCLGIAFLHPNIRQNRFLHFKKRVAKLSTG